MNKLWLVIGAACVLQACAPKTVAIDLGDLEAYGDFLQARGEGEELKPFKAEPLNLTATGKVKAMPDIAVITATISAEDINESKAFSAMSERVNGVQTALSDRKVETGFTSLRSQREFDETCQNANRLAMQRQSQIQSDHYFNQSLDRRGDTITKRRAPKSRLPQEVCRAQSIKLSTNMVIRIQPASAAGEVLKALADAGAEKANLFGYDFTNYDKYYQEASEKAVDMARKKAEAHARLAGTKLGNIESFFVTPPTRTGRFGPQPNVIRSASRYQGATGSAIDRQVNERAIPSVTKQNTQRKRFLDSAPTVASFSCWDGSVVTSISGCPTLPQTVNYVACWDGSTIMNGGSCPPEYGPELPAGNSLSSGRVSANASGGFISGGSGMINTTNALSMSLLSGPQTISVTATLSFNYETPLDGKVIMAAK